MSEAPNKGLVSRKTAELCFAVLLLVFGIIMMIGAREMDTGWGSSGPEAGYFPFRIGVLIVIAALVLFVQELRKANAGQTLFDSSDSVRNLAFFAVPLVALIALIPVIGIYLAAFLYLFIAIGLIARVRMLQAMAIALLTPVAMFVLFEFVFRTPLPKGPLGPLLGMP